MKALVFDRIGSPLEVLELRDVPRPTPRPGEALVRMVSSSINPGDFLFVENLYPEPKKPALPGQIAGGHGAGIVEAAGPGVSLVEPGTLVAFSYRDAWAEYAAVPQEWLIPLPAGFDPDTAGQIVNLVTAWDLLDQSGVASGGWLAVTAGSSTVSTLVLQYAKACGVNVISIVRRSQAGPDLKALGAAEVIDLSAPGPGIAERIRDVTGGTGLHGVVDNVGGPLLGDLVRSTALGARVIINGGMSAERFQLHNFDVLMNLVEIRPHVYRFFFDPPGTEHRPFLDRLVATSQSIGIQAPVAGRFPLEDFRTALELSVARPGEGKRLFRM
jgi:NADPH:quinone reductase-like Zn-dependent oxidoreductase